MKEQNSPMPRRKQLVSDIVTVVTVETLRNLLLQPIHMHLLLRKVTTLPHSLVQRLEHIVSEVTRLKKGVLSLNLTESGGY